MMSVMARRDDLRRTADSLRRLVIATEGLPVNSLADARLRDRLEFAAVILEVASEELEIDQDQ